MADDIRETARQARVEKIHESWLRNRITIAEAESKHLVDFSLGADTSEAAQRFHAGRLRLARARSVALDGKPVPFGFMNQQWRELIASMVEGDELWEYSNSDASWHGLAGRAGIALVRKGKIFDCLLTSMS